MDDEKIKGQIGANIAERRKAAGMTQAGLAEKINYSDKAVSKWERGESVPDVLTMMQLAQLFGVTVNDLLQSPAKANIPATPRSPRPAGGSFRGFPPLSSGLWPCFSMWSSPPLTSGGAGCALSTPFR